jgi:hypothetical protein
VKRKPKTSHLECVSRAKSSPGQWIEVTTYRSRYSAQGIAFAIKGGRMPYYLPASHWITQLVDTEDGTALFIKYVGEPDV